MISMIKVFIYYEKENKWIEELSNILYHDFVAFIDEETKIIYLWNGPQNSKERKKKGTEALNDLINMYTDINFQVKNYNKKTPSLIKNKLNKLLELTKKEQELSGYQYSHFSTIRLHSFFSIVTVILPIIILFILGYSLFWDKIGNSYIINARNYNYWLSSASILLLICLLLFIPQLIMGAYEFDKPIIVFSSTSIIICISLLFYLQQGIFLFQFQEPSTGNLYYISETDIIIFLLLILFTILLLEIPILINTIKFFSTYKKFIF
jgi:hypothetical protein